MPSIWKTISKRHKHQWDKVSQVTVDSLLDRYRAVTAFSPIGAFPHMGAWIFEKKTVTFFRCECGKKKRVITAH